MRIKLDINIKLDSIILEGNGILRDDSIKKLSIKFNNVDDRFQIFNCINRHQLFIDTNNMRIICTDDAPNGRLSNQAIVLPFLKNIGGESTLSFFDDESRKNYLKKLYGSLISWGDNWHGFRGDSKTKIHVDGDRWVVYSEELDIYDIF